ncbi:MAG: hypothetical protein V1778_00290, partial [bacterium]
GERAAALFGWNPLILLFAINELHNDLLLVLFLALSIFFLQRRLFLLSGTALLVGALIKWIPLVLLPLVLVLLFRERPWRKALTSTLLLCGLALALFAIAFLPFWDGQNPLAGLFRQSLMNNFTLFVGQGALSLGVWNNLPSVLTHLQEIPASALGVSITKTIGVLLFLGLTTTTLLRVWRRRLAFGEAGFFLLFLFILFLLSWMQYWYILWLFPFAALHRGLLRMTAGFSMVLLFGMLLPLILGYTILLVVLAFWNIGRRIIPSISTPSGKELSLHKEAT